MRQFVTLAAFLVLPVMANASQTAPAPSEPQAYCVSRNADFYPYAGKPCQSGYQLGAGNCRRPDGQTVAISKEQCLALAGKIELPYEGGVRPALSPQKIGKAPLGCEPINGA